MLDRMKDKIHRVSAKIYVGDIGVNQAAEVGGLVGVAAAVTAGIATAGPTVGKAIGTWLEGKF